MALMDLIKEKAKSDLKRIVLPEGTEERTVCASQLIAEQGIAHVILLGKPDEIQKVADANGVDLSKVEILDYLESADFDRYVDEFYELFEDLCTVKEIKDMSQRLQVATLLRKGNSYQKVSELTSVSSATISRVKRCLDYGAGGYGKVLERLEDKK